MKLSHAVSPSAAALLSNRKPSAAVKRTAPQPIFNQRQKQQAVDAISSMHVGQRPSTAFDRLDLPAWDDGDPAAVFLAALEPQPLPPHAMDGAVQEALDLACADRKRGRSHTGVKAWFAFCAELGITPDRPIEPTAPLWVKLQEEQRAMNFVCALVERRGISVRSASNYWSAVQGWHAREHGIKLAAGIKLERMPQLLKGLRRKHGDPARKLRRGVSARMLRKGMDILFPRADPESANMRAALALAFQGLLRSAEFSTGKGKRWVAQFGLARGDIQELNGERIRLLMWAAKSAEHIGGKSCPLAIGAGATYVDAVAELINLMRVDPLAAGDDPAEIPLFRRPGTDQPLETEDVMAAIRRIVQLCGEDPSEYGTHSLRIGGATALFAAGADMTVIRTMGRWSSDIYSLYVRACLERCCDWSRRAGSVAVTDLEGTIDEVYYY